MDACHNRNSCDSCSARVVCHCLQITEELVLSAVDTFGVQSLMDLRQLTGAGDGCTACHRQLRQLIEGRVPLPVVQPSSASPI